MSHVQVGIWGTSSSEQWSIDTGWLSMIHHGAGLMLYGCRAGGSCGQAVDIDVSMYMCIGWVALRWSWLIPTYMWMVCNRVSHDCGQRNLTTIQWITSLDSYCLCNVMSMQFIMGMNDLVCGASARGREFIHKRVTLLHCLNWLCILTHLLSDRGHHPGLEFASVGQRDHHSWLPHLFQKPPSVAHYEHSCCVVRVCDGSP